MPQTNSTCELAVLLARLGQGWRYGWSELLVLMAHSVQFFGKRTGILRLIGAVIYCFVNRYAVQVGKPSLDIPSRNDGDRGVCWFSRRHLLGPALIIKLGSSGLRRMCVRVNDDDQEGILPAANGLQFAWVLFSNPLLAGLGAMWKRQCCDVASFELSSAQESAYERVRGCVLAEQYDLDAHSQRLAMISESDRPSAVFFGSLLTRTGPSPSRKNHLPFAPAM